jgi:hypothetical protein
MEATEKKAFLQMLTDALASYGKPLPTGALLQAWWNDLQAYPLRVVGMAFAAYRDENGEFAPVPAGIAKRCKLMDGRPGEEEAWAMALLSRDESETIIWTQEIAEAFGIARPVLETSGEITARKTFLEAYIRLVSAARLAHQPVRWMASLGWDARKRTEALTRAQTAGLLSAPMAQNLLPAPEGFAAPTDEASRQGLAKVKEALRELQAGWQRDAERRTAEVQAQRDAVAQKKNEIAELVKAYGAGATLAEERL